MKKLIILGAVLFGMATSSWASSFSAGSFGGAWGTSLSYGPSDWRTALLSWNATAKNRGLWTYDYWWNAGNKDLFSWDSYGTTIQGFGNEKWGTVTGLRWNPFRGGITGYHLTLISTRPFMWGNSYPLYGPFGGAYAKNSKFAINTQGTGLGWEVVPSTVVIPIPSAVWLLGPAFIGIVGLRKRFNK